jgi:phosphopantothenoylcysteine decarboxylase/phosphopantothenate--cysteine ligase
MGSLQSKNIVLGVSGGIAAYKAATIASMLVQSGAHVQVVMTEGARRFIQPLTFSAITHAPVHAEVFAPWGDDFSGHVSIADRADVLVVAPATAATIARLSLGLGDDLLGLVALSTRAPLLLAPAMEDHMLQHPATQEHLQTLIARGAVIVGPERGRLASGAIGEGRMAEPATIVRGIERVLRQDKPLSGANIVVTAGGTREPLDPVRYIGNRSSGRMGYAIAAAAAAAGADVSLISGPTHLLPPAGVTAVFVETAADMQQAVERAVSSADMLIMSAAVADFRPETASHRKIKKESGTEPIEVRLIRNPDILASIARPGLVKIGFAAETDDLLKNAAHKLQAKRLDMIVANDAESTIGADESEATILTADGTVRPLPRMPKEALATEIVRAAAKLLSEVRQGEA